MLAHTRRGEVLLLAPVPPSAPPPGPAGTAFGAMAGAIVIVCAAVLSSNIAATLAFAQLDEESWVRLESEVFETATSVTSAASRLMTDEE